MPNNITKKPNKYFKPNKYKFHVMKLVNKTLKEIRLNLELKGLKNRCLLLKNEADLTESKKLD